MANNPSLPANIPSHTLIDLNSVYAKWSQPYKQMHKVSTMVRALAQQSAPSEYDPVMVSLGPYHHGKVEFRQAEEFKYLCVDWCSRGSEVKKSSLYDAIMNVIGEIKDCYAEVSIINKYNDHALTLMMLLDACFIVNFMEYCCGKKRDIERVNCIGVEPTLSLTARDILVLENQIPYFVLKLLIGELYDEQEGIELLQKFLGFFMLTGLHRVEVPREDKDPPIHFLDACRRVRTEKPTPNPIVQQQQYSHYRLLSSCRFRWPRFMMMSNDARHKSNTYNTCIGRSVMDLKAKGIKVRPSSSYSYKDINFHSHALYGELQLPVGKVSYKTRVNLSNMIAYELSPHGDTEPVVLSYVIFMKSLIQTPEDVKELQEKGIFQANRFANLEEVVQLFKNINTFGLDSQIKIHKDVMHMIGKHCNNKAKTWMAELIRGNFKSPWTIIALLAATLIVILTFLQTYYTMHPVKNRVN